MTITRTQHINAQKLNSSHFYGFDSEFALQSFFDTSNKDTVWYGNERYEYVYKDVKYQFTFSQAIIKRSRKEGKNGFKFDIFDPCQLPKGKGGYGVVYPIVATFIRNNEGQMTLKPGKKKLVKIEEHSQIDRTDSVQQEYKNLLRAGHLRVKKPIISTEKQSKKSYLIMEDVDGFTLEQILNPKKHVSIADKIPKLTVYRRLELTLAILHAIKEQTVDRNLLHRDIKPGNIIVDLNQNPLVVKLIDFGFAIEKEIQDYRRLGTRAYRAPESFESSPIYTSKSDIYSTGRLLSYLWGDNYLNYYVDKDKNYDYIKTKSTNEQLFSLPDIDLVLDDADKKRIGKYLNSMINENPCDRPDIDQLIRLFSKIDKQKYRAPDETKYSVQYLREFNQKLNPQLQTVEQHLIAMKRKQENLQVRGYKDAARVMSNLITKIEGNTCFLKNNPNPEFMLRYRQSCLDEIESSRKTLREHRDSYWILAEIASAIGLLGVGYLFAVGINYYQSGRLGLFSQTKSDQLASELKDIIPMDLVGNSR